MIKIITWLVYAIISTNIDVSPESKIADEPTPHLKRIQKSIMQNKNQKKAVNHEDTAFENSKKEDINKNKPGSKL